MYPAPPSQPVFARLCLGLVLLRLAPVGVAGFGFPEPRLLCEGLGTRSPGAAGEASAFPAHVSRAGRLAGLGLREGAQEQLNSRLGPREPRVGRGREAEMDAEMWNLLLKFPPFPGEGESEAER